MPYLHLMIDENTRYFENYLALIKNTVDEDEKRIEDYVKRSEIRKDNISAEEQERLIDDISNEYFEADEMGQLMYRSFVMSIFIFMEAQISALSSHIYKEQKQKFRPNDLRGAGVTRSINYVETVLGIQFPSDSELRYEFEIAKTIRNSIAHSDGLGFMNEGEKTKVERYIRENPDKLSLDNSGLSIKYDYAKKLIYLNEAICKEISKYWKELW